MAAESQLPNFRMRSETGTVGQEAGCAPQTSDLAKALPALDNQSENPSWRIAQVSPRNTWRCSVPSNRYVPPVPACSLIRTRPFFFAAGGSGSMGLPGFMSGSGSRRNYSIERLQAQERRVSPVPDGSMRRPQRLWKPPRNSSCSEPDSIRGPIAWPLRRELPSLSWTTQKPPLPNRQY